MTVIKTLSILISLDARSAKAAKEELPTGARGESRPRAPPRGVTSRTRQVAHRNQGQPQPSKPPKRPENPGLRRSRAPKSMGRNAVWG